MLQTVKGSVLEPKENNRLDLTFRKTNNDNILKLNWETNVRVQTGRYTARGPSELVRERLERLVGLVSYNLDKTGKFRPHEKNPFLGTPLTFIDPDLGGQRIFGRIVGLVILNTYEIWCSHIPVFGETIHRKVMNSWQLHEHIKTNNYENSKQLAAIVKKWNAAGGQTLLFERFDRYYLAFVVESPTPDIARSADGILSGRN